jgi:hypothetical protein
VIAAALIVGGVFLILATVVVLAVWLYRLGWSRSIARHTSDLVDAHKSLLHFCRAGQQNGFRFEISQTLMGTLFRPYFDDSWSVLVDIDGRGRIPPDIELGSETDKTRAQGGDIVTEDQLFDHAALILGSEVTALALLDHDTRDAVLSLLERGGIVSHSWIRTPCSTLELGWIIPGLIGLAGKLSMKKGEIPGRLAANVEHDRKPEVRARNFVVLQQHFAGSEAAESAARLARTSQEPLLRFEAAAFDQDHEQLTEIATCPEHPSRLRARAVEALTRASWAEVAIPVLMQLLDSDDPLVQKAAVVGLGRFRHRPAVARLMTIATGFKVTVVRAVAEALGRIGDPAAEPTLIELLRHPDREVFEATLRALGRAGTVAAVEPLRELAEWLTEKSHRAEVEQSIQRIQSRVAGAEIGQLSIAGVAEPDGGLSLAGEIVEGALSRVDEEKPRGPAQPEIPAE